MDDSYEQPRRRIQHSSLSLKSLRIHVLNKQGHQVMVGTGFLFIPEDFYTPADLNRVALVTNFHVVTNRKLNGEAMDPTSRDQYPFSLRVYLPSPVAPDEENPEGDSFDIELLTGEVGEYKRTWYSEYEVKDGQRSQTLGPDHVGDYPATAASDIAVIPIPKVTVDEYKLADRAYFWDRRAVESKDFQYALRPTEVVHVIGYPFSAKEFTSNMPIWTSGSVANEVNSGPEERFLIDARTRPGQSGSPVVLYRAETTAGKPLPVTIPEMGLLLGVYSGRTGDGEDLGFVWWGTVISAIYWSIPHSKWS